MTFAWPYLLWLLVIPFGLLTFELSRRRRAATTDHAKILRAEAGAHSLRLTSLSAASSPRSPRSRPWLWVGIGLAIVAAARPQWGRLEEPVFDQSREILIAIDLSRSMLTPDVKPSRLDRAKLLTQSLLEKLAGERVGLAVFSGTAFLQSPLSADYEILREFLPALNPEFLPEGGTNYRALIDTSIDAFRSTASADRFLIVLSDGEATTDDWRERIPELKKKNIRVIGLGVGTTAGAMIPDGSGGLVKDERGAVVLSKLESGTLRDLADATNGVYQDASSWIDPAALVSATVDSGKKGEFTEKNTVRLVERFQWPLGLALWCLLVSFYYEFPVRPRPRDLKLMAEAPVSKPTPRTAVASLLVIFGLLSVAGIFSSAAIAADAPAAPTPPLLSRIVGRLSASADPSARDWSDMARETETWGTKLQSSQQAVPPGPVEDALTAVELGSRLDPKVTDWAKLKAELEALLKKPDEKKQDQKDDQKDQDQQQKDQNQDQNKDQQKQDQQKKDEQKQDNQQQQQKDPSNSQDPSQQKDPNDQKSDPKNRPQKDSAFGDMKKGEPPPPPEENTQKVGGSPKREERDQPPVDPSLALPLQKLDQLRNQDSPAELFKMIEGERDPTPRKKTKDW